MHLKTIFLAVLCLAIAGCKVEMVTTRGGTIRSESYEYQCTIGSSTCGFSISDIYFDETFVADPDKNYVFVGWKKRNRGFCGGSLTPCRLVTSSFEGNDVLTSLLENQDEAFYLEAVFMHEDDVNAEKIAISGTWDYVEEWVAKDNPGLSCTATGMFLHEAVDGEGLYVTLKNGSKRVSELSDLGCEYLTQENERRSLFTKSTFTENVIAREIASWQSGVHQAIILSPNKYTILFDFTRNDRLIHGSMTYTRVQ